MKGRKKLTTGGLKMRRNYVLRPEVRIHSDERALCGYAAAVEAVKASLSKVDKAEGPVVLVVECYPGTRIDEVRSGLIDPLAPSLAIFADDYAQTTERVQERISDHITDDRVFGVMSHYTIEQFYDEDQVKAAREKVGDAEGLVVVYGFGTTVLCEPDVIVYSSITRWEAQLRYRAGARNWKCNNADEEPLRKFKRGYFFEWRMADRQKRALSDRIDFLMDTVEAGNPHMVSGAGWRRALGQVAHQPFRMVPYFDASVWGGHWMQERFGLDPEAPNYGWSFDGVPEENSVILDFNGVGVEVPAQDVVSSNPEALLGARVHSRFGMDFPIRFDYLDTMGGGNLSLQVHPLTEYIQDRFGMAYTQDESYYILDSTDESCVYLGVKTGVEKDDLVDALSRAAEGGYRFPDEEFVNRSPVKKHDHVHIPAGTIHCGGAGTVILEISATPYIFTFKLWDWGRVGLDGKPRPIHIGHGAPNIRMDRDTECVNERLIDRADAPHEDLSTEPGVRVERTGLDEVEFIETRRYWFRESATLESFGSVNELNLIEGEAAAVESLDGSFDPFEVHYGETFIVPESVGSYRIRNIGDADGEIAVIQAFVRS